MGRVAAFVGVGLIVLGALAAMVPVLGPSLRPSVTGTGADIPPPSDTEGVNVARSATTAPYVAYTLVLLNNSVVPGNFHATNSLHPRFVAYDSGKGEWFVANGGTVSVISDATNTVVATVKVGGSDGVAYDDARGEIFVANSYSNSVSVISDATNTVVATIPVGVNPLGVAFDGGKGEVFVANSDSNSVSVISDATNTVVATVPVGSYPYGVAYDGAKGEVFVSTYDSKGLSVISDATNTVVATIAVGDTPLGVAYDSGRGELFVVTIGSNMAYVSVISDSTNNVVATIPIAAGRPGWIAYDGSRGEVFVPNSLSNSVSVIADATNTVVATIAVGDTPMGVAYDAGKAEVLVSNTYSNDLSVISDTTNAVVATIRVATSPGVVAYDSGRGEVFVANTDSNSVSVISETTNRLVATIPVRTSQSGLAYDQARSEVFVANSGSNSVSVISDATNTVVATIPVGTDPRGMAYDAGKGEIFVANYYSNSLSVISDATNTVVATILVGGGPTGVAYDAGKGEVFVANNVGNSVSVISDATNTVVATIGNLGIGFHPTGFAYDSGRGEVFVANDFATRISSSSVIVISDATNQVVANITVGHSPEELAYDAVRGEVFVTNSASGTVSVIADDTNTVIATIAVGQGPFGAAYDDGIGYVYVSSEAEGTVSIISPGTPAPPPPTYPVSFTETGLPAGTSWSATLDGATLTSTTNTVTLAKANGTYAYSVGSVSGYTVSPSQGSVTVNGAGVSTSITFTAVPPPTYDVTFTDTGLPAGTTWAVTLAGTTHTSTGNAIAFSMTDGTYAYTIGSVPGYSTTPGSGSIAVHGSAVAKTVAWTPVMYTVTFEESGLSPSTSWSVTVQGTTQSSTSTQIVFSEPNGTVYYYIVSVAGYTTSPTSGTMTVNGHDVMRSVTFTQTVGPPTIGSFSASASAFVLGSSVTLTITASGGTGVLTYAYGGLPAGCSSANVSALTCTPTATGVFRITATVTDAAGRRATATVDVTVNPPFMSTVDCGQGLTCSIRSNAALSNVRFTGNTIRFTATGPLETQAYANMTVPKAAIQNIHSVHVRVNHNSIDDSAMIVTSDGTNYYLYITFALHSAVEIDIELAPTADVRLTIFGLDPPILFGTTAFILSIAPLGALVALRRKKRSVR